MRTRADGWFKLEGTGERVTAWHPGYSPATVERGAAERIVLLPHASLDLRLLDLNGAPRAAVPVRLDDRRRGPEMVTDESGRLNFPSLEAGVHALWENRTLLAAVRLAPGQHGEVDVQAPQLDAVELDLRSADGTALPGSLDGIVVGEGDVFGLHEFRWTRAGEPTGGGPRLEGPLRPGAYLMLSREGFSSRFEIGGPQAELNLASGRLLVSAKPGTRLQVVPSGADWFLRLLAARVPAVVPETGELAFHVEPGSWLVVGQRGVQLARVVVAEEGARLALDQ